MPAIPKGQTNESAARNTPAHSDRASDSIDWQPDMVEPPAEKGQVDAGTRNNPGADTGLHPGGSGGDTLYERPVLVQQIISSVPGNIDHARERRQESRGDDQAGSGVSNVDSRGIGLSRGLRPGDDLSEHSRVADRPELAQNILTVPGASLTQHPAQRGESPSSSPLLGAAQTERLNGVNKVIPKRPKQAVLKTPEELVIDERVRALQQRINEWRGYDLKGESKGKIINESKSIRTLV